MASFTPSPAELALVTQIFLKADPQKIGILTGDAALKVFGGANLSPTVLGEIWNIADEDNNGWLSKKGVAIAIRLMGWAQKGENVTQALINKPGPLPTLEGIQVPLNQQITGISLPKSPPPGLPILTPQDKAKFMSIFQNSQPTSGLLSGEKARNLFVKSKLPVEKLGQIWNLADTQDRGALDATDFIVGMYLIQGSMSGQLSFIPTSLPPGLYEQASSGVVANTTGSGVPVSPVSPAYFGRAIKGTQQQHTGPTILQVQTTGPKKAPVLPVRKPTGPPAGSLFATTQPAWDVTPAEKAAADRYFDTLDSQKLGYIEGDVAVPFMLQSNLPEEVLAQVWDLADISNDGRLTRDGFAVAMHLIQGKLSGKDIPTSLPQSLVPPSMRTNGASPHSVPAPQPAFQPQEPHRDLLWDDTPPSSASPPPSQAQSSMFVSTAISPHKPQAAVQDPFGVTSSPRNLLDDDEPSIFSPPLQDQSAEIGNVQIQLNSTNQSLANAKAEREPLEQTLATQAAQLSALQTQLSSAKAAYETETKLLSTLRDRMAVQTADIQKAREELIRAESDLSAVRVEKAEIEGAFLRDKEDVRELHRKMAKTETEIAGLKLEIERAKKEAKQQKGLLAIAKKQLSTKEIEKSKVVKELEEAVEEVKEATAEREAAELKEDDTSISQNGHGIVHSPVARSSDVDSMAMTIAQPLPSSLPVTTDPVTPSASSMKSNNPFDRLTRSASSASHRSRSPFPSFPDTTLVKASTAEPFDAPVDPFGFEQAFTEQPATEKQPEPVTTEAVTVTPRSDPVKLSISDIPHDEKPISPASANDSDFFSTPPTTVTGLSQSPASSNRLSEVPSVESQFPPIDGIPGSSPVPEVHGAETDLGVKLQEIEVEESDSDNDEEPLSDVQHKLRTSVGSMSDKGSVANGVQSAPFDDTFGDSTSGSESTDLQTPKVSLPAHADSLTSSFSVPTDSLGSSIASEPLSTDAFGAPLTKTSNPLQPEPRVAGVNVFDEAMGKMPSNSVTPSAPSLSFDTAFEDNFDFASVSGTTAAFAPPPTTINGSGKNPLLPSQDGGFDNTFNLSANNGTPSLPPVDGSKPSLFFNSPPVEGSATPVAEQPPKLPPRKASLSSATAITFDDAFGGVGASQALKLDNAFDSISSKESGATSSVSRPFPAMHSPPLSPKGTISSPHLSSTPPPRTMSPPPRLNSPGPPRSSTSSSSKDGHDKPNPPRHSRLSIRLPFGKKKSKQDAAAPPVPSSYNYNQFLSPLEEPTMTQTPAVDDDVDSVKQLCGMGFSRTQAVTALERHGYDMQRALNSLLGTQ